MLGQTLAHYEILDKLGSGGMGDVYRARDTKLRRDVAIKVLPEAYASDRERMARFENLVAMELLARTHLWTESGDDDWGLHYVRTRDGKETDFLLTKRRKPWCLLECKLRKTSVESHHRLFASKLGGIPVVQLVKQHGELEAKQRDVVSVSAARFLSS